VITRLCRLERHPPMTLAVGTPGKLGSTAEVETGLPRFADRPTAVSAPKVEERFLLAGFGRFLDAIGHIDPAAHARSAVLTHC
jgi:hypothetical protein